MKETCHLLYNQNTAATLKKSQNLCNLAQSNLAIFENEAQIKDFLSINSFQKNIWNLNLFKKKKVNYIMKMNLKTRNFWISLNNIKDPDVLEWVDGTSLSYKYTIEYLRH